MVTHEKCMGNGYVGRVCGRWLCMKNAHVMVGQVKNVQVMAMQKIDGQKKIGIEIVYHPSCVCDSLPFMIEAKS